MSYRLFFAIWPDRRLQQHIEKMLSRYEWPRSTKLILPQNWHLTLTFLGKITEQYYQQLLPLISYIEIPSFVITFDKLEYWPRQEILMLSPSFIPEPLVQLNKEITRILQKQNLPVEKREYEPHITLARNLSADFVLQKINLGFLDFPLEYWVRDFCLADTSLRDNGKSKHYQILNHWPLGC